MKMKKKKQFQKKITTPKYVASMELKLNRIEVYSFSKSSCPYYTITLPDGKIVTIGGALTGNRLSEIENPIFEARDFSHFVPNIHYYMETGKALYPYETARFIHRVVADTGWFKEPARVLIDLYDNGQIGLGASNYFYLKTDNGKFSLHFDEVQLNKIL